MVARDEIVSQAELARRAGIRRETVADLVRVHRVQKVRVGDSLGIDYQGYLKLAPHITEVAPSA